MSLTIIQTDDAPAAIGPYSQAVVANGMVYCSGQIALDPKTGEIAAGIEAQTTRVLNNLSAVLRAAGSDLSKVVKATIFIKNMDDFATVNRIYGTFFTGAPPARSTVEVSRLPRDVLVEIEAIAVVGS